MVIQFSRYSQPYMSQSNLKKCSKTSVKFLIRHYDLTFKYSINGDYFKICR